MPVWRGTWTISNPALGGTGTNTWHCRTIAVSGDPAEKDQLDALNLNLGQFYVDVADIYAAQTTLNFNGEWVRVDDDSGTIVRGGSNQVVVPGAGNPLPPSQCLVVGWGTNTASKSARGRTFLGPCTVGTLQDNGTPEEASRTLIEQAAADFIDSFDGVGNGAFGVWSIKQQVLRDFTDGRVANRFASLRSRRD
jgi:hypothetical protein